MFNPFEKARYIQTPTAGNKYEWEIQHLCININHPSNERNIKNKHQISLDKKYLNRDGATDWIKNMFKCATESFPALSLLHQISSLYQEIKWLQGKRKKWKKAWPPVQSLPSSKHFQTKTTQQIEWLDHFYNTRVRNFNPKSILTFQNI